MDTPLLLIHFNRPEVTQLQIDSLSTIQPKRLWLLCDGAREGREGEADAVNSVRQILQGISWECETHYLFRDQNLGCYRNISSGIDWFLSEAGAGIILEDDCFANASFFMFCSELLQRYDTDDRVFSISGYNGLNSEFPMEASYGFSNYFSCWGWATWKRAWDQFDPEIEAFKDKSQWGAICSRMQHFGIRQKVYWKLILNRVLSGKTDSWAYRFQLSSWQHRGLSIIPKLNLIENVGFDQLATNTQGLEQRRVEKIEMQFPMEHPDEVVVDPKLDVWIEDNWHSKNLKLRFRWLFRKVFKNG